MYRSGMVDTLVIHANTNWVWPNFLVRSPPWLYASSVKNKTTTKKTITLNKEEPTFKVFFYNISHKIWMTTNKSPVHSDSENDLILSLLSFSKMQKKTSGGLILSLEKFGLIPHPSSEIIYSELVFFTAFIFFAKLSMGSSQIFPRTRSDHHLQFFLHVWKKLQQEDQVQTF